jgi:hypothetical protein
MSCERKCNKGACEDARNALQSNIGVVVRIFFDLPLERQLTVTHTAAGVAEVKNTSPTHPQLNLLFKTMAAVSQISKKRKVWRIDFMDDG